MRRSQQPWRYLTGAVLTSLTIIWLSLFNLPGLAKPRPEPILLARSSDYYSQLEEADRFYREGNLQMAERIQRQVKPAFSGGGSAVPPAILQPDSPQLAGAAQVYWRNAQEGIQQNLESKIFQPLQLLAENYPDFIPGHLALAEQCEKSPEACQRNADGDQPQTAVAVLDRATSLYPEQSGLLDQYIALLDRTAEREDSFEPWLEASLVARQFSIAHPDHPQATQYKSQADEYMAKFRRGLHEKLFANQIANLVISQFTGSADGKQVVEMLSQGETAFGTRAVNEHLQKTGRVEDSALQGYVDRVGQKIAKLMGRDEFEYEFFITPGDDFDARAFPGGKVVITAGTLRALGSEAELAGLLSHEIAHAALSHSFRRISENMAVSGFFQIFGSLGDVMEDFVNPKYNRSLERQADEVGTRVLARSGYSADGLYTVMGLLKEMDTRISTPWTATHPIANTRFAYLEDLITRNGYNRYAFEGVSQYRAIANRLGQVVTAQGGGTPNTSSALAPQTSAPRRNTSTVGPVALVATQNRDDVVIRLTGATVSTSGSYTVKFAIENNTAEPFGFVPVFAQVLDADGQRITARFSMNTEGNAFVPPGQTLEGQAQVVGRDWDESGTQNLTLVIKEATVGVRVFRVPF